MKNKALRLMAAGGLMAAVFLPAAAAHADYGGGDTSGQGTSDQGTSTGSTSSGEPLPFTGGDVIGLSLMGAGLAAGGVVLVRGSRRRAANV